MPRKKRKGGKTPINKPGPVNPVSTSPGEDYIMPNALEGSLNPGVPGSPKVGDRVEAGQPIPGYFGQSKKPKGKTTNALPEVRNQDGSISKPSNQKPATNESSKMRTSVRKRSEKVLVPVDRVRFPAYTSVKSQDGVITDVIFEYPVGPLPGPAAGGTGLRLSRTDYERVYDELVQLGLIDSRAEGKLSGTEKRALWAQIRQTFDEAKLRKQYNSHLDTYNDPGRIGFEQLPTSFYTRFREEVQEVTDEVEFVAPGVEEGPGPQITSRAPAEGSFYFGKGRLFKRGKQS